MADSLVIVQDVPTAYTNGSKALAEVNVRVWKPFLNHWLFCRLTDAIQHCCASQNLQTLRIRLLTELHEGVRYIVDLPPSLKSLKLTVWAAPQVDALRQLSSLNDLDLEFGERFGGMGMETQEQIQQVSWAVKEVFATFKTILCIHQFRAKLFYVEGTRNVFPRSSRPPPIQIHNVPSGKLCMTDSERCQILSIYYQPYLHSKCIEPHIHSCSF